MIAALHYMELRTCQRFREAQNPADSPEASRSIKVWADHKGITDGMTQKEVIHFIHATANKIFKYGTTQRRTNLYLDIYDTPA